MYARLARTYVLPMLTWAISSRLAENYLQGKFVEDAFLGSEQVSGR